MGNPDGMVVELVVALAVAWLICFFALSKGVQSLGKVMTLFEDVTMIEGNTRRLRISLLYFRT